MCVRERRAEAVVYTNKGLKFKVDCTTMGKGELIFFKVLSPTSSVT